MSLTPHAQELAAIDASVTKAIVTLHRKASLAKLAALTSIAAHPLVGQKYPGVNPQPATWPAISSQGALGEQWQLRVPQHHSPLGAPAPILVVVNQSGASHTLAATSTALADGAAARGWFYLSVKCLTALTFPGAMASLSLDAVLRSVIEQYDVDRERIYLVGASRGAGILLNWAATRQAGTALMPAAVVAISPLLELREWWSKLPPESGTGQPLGASDNTLATRAHSERPDNAAGAWGESPAVDHRYRTHGVLHFQPGSYEEYPDFGGSPDAAVDGTRSIATCLAQLPAWILHDTADPVAVIPPGCDKLVALLGGLPGAGVLQTVTDGVGALHGFGLLDVPGGTTTAQLLDFLEPQRARRYPASLHVVAADDVLFGITRPTRVDPDDTCRYDFAQSLTPEGSGYVLTAVERLARIELDVAHDAALAGFDFHAGSPFTLSSSAGTVLRVKHLHHAPSFVSGSGILPGGEGVGWFLGVDGPESVEVLPAGPGPMEVSFF
jgi:acetyl esterase/lipase